MREMREKYLFVSLSLFLYMYGRYIIGEEDREWPWAIPARAQVQLSHGQRVDDCCVWQL